MSKRRIIARDARCSLPTTSTARSLNIASHMASHSDARPSSLVVWITVADNKVDRASKSLRFISKTGNRLLQNYYEIWHTTINHICFLLLIDNTTPIWRIKLYIYYLLNLLWKLGLGLGLDLQLHYFFRFSRRITKTSTLSSANFT